MKRRDFIKTAVVGSIAAGTVGTGIISGCADKKPAVFNFNRLGSGSGLKLSFEPYELQLRHTFTVSSYSRKTTPGVQVRLEYEGYTGYGEASMPPYLGQSVETVTSFLKRTDLSQFNDPLRIESILDYVDSLSDGDGAAKAAIDIALHDLVGKLIGLPWWRIWGLDKETTPDTTFTIGIDTPEIISTIREITDLPLAVDANQGWKDREKALDEIFWLKENGVVMVEQPMAKERLDDNAWITERSPLPIFADEAIQRLADIPAIKGAYSGINIKLMKCTGMREAWKMLNYARTEGMKAMIGCMTDTSCAVSAAAQLAPAVDFADLDGNLLITNDLYKGMEVIDGKITLNDLPGIGLTPLV